MNERPTSQCLPLPRFAEKKRAINKLVGEDTGKETEGKKRMEL